MNLQNFADSQKNKDNSGHSAVALTLSASYFRGGKSKFPQKQSFNGKCFRCGKPGYYKSSCTVSVCEFCQKSGHSENRCWKKRIVV